MKIGDLVLRRIDDDGVFHAQPQDSGLGIVLSKQLGGSNPVHSCVTVFYPKTGKTYDIAESHMDVISEVINENR